MSTTALSATTPAPTEPETELLLQEEVAAGRDAFAAAAAVLLREVGCRSAAVYRVDSVAGGLVLLAARPAEPSAPIVGSRVHQPTGALGAALRSGTLQRATNSYVDPDFVRRLPGETRSELAVPVHGADRLLGVVHLEYAPPHQPTPADEVVAGRVADWTGPALASLAGAGPSDDRRRSAVLASLCHVVAHSDDPRAALGQVVDGARELARCEAAVLLTRHSARQMLEVAAVAGSIPCKVGDLFPLHEGVAGEVLRSGQPRAHRHPAAGATLLGSAPELSDLRDALLVPVTTGGKPQGVLAVLNRASDAGEFGADDVEALLCAASQAGAVECSRQAGALRQRLSDVATIAEVGRAMTGTLGVDEVLSLVVRAAEMLANGRGVVLGLISDDHQQLTLESTAGVFGRARGQVVSAQESVMGWVAVMGEVLISPSISEDPRGYPHEARQGPAVVVPLESGGRPLGALMVTRGEGAPLPSDDDVDALRKLAAYAAIAIDNARLYREQTELSTVLRAQAEELERAYAGLRESQQQLLVSEKMAALGRLTAGIAHEINSPLGGIMNCLQLGLQYAREYQSSAGDPEVTAQDHAAIAKDLIDTLAMAESATRKVGQFVRTIKAQTRTGDDTTRVTFDAAAEIDGVLTLLQHEIRNRQVTLHTECEPHVRLLGDPGKFALVVQNLVSNAIDAHEGAAGEVWIRLRERDDRVVLEVKDLGCGIAENIRSRIFDYLFTTKDVGQGTGLGLSIVHSIVTTHFQGTIELQSEVGSGTTFILQIPASPREA